MHTLADVFAQSLAVWIHALRDVLAAGACGIVVGSVALQARRAWLQARASARIERAYQARRRMTR